MINPSKTSASMAPTMIVCVVIGFLTPILAGARNPSARLIAAAVAGLILGFAVSIRLPNLFLSAGYFVVLLATAIASRRSGDILRLGSFAAAYAVGLVPTLIANAINAGSIFSTTYGPVDALPPDFSFSIIREYADMQGALIILAVAWTALTLIKMKTATAIVAVNLVTNSAFFLPTRSPPRII